MFVRFSSVLVLLLLLSAVSGAASLPRGFSPSQFNGSGKPVVKDGVVTFQIFDQQCGHRNYDDNRGESDCTNGNIRSAADYAPDARIGQTLDYRFDIQVESDFAYQGYSNDHAAGFYPNQWDSRLRIASWEGPLLHNFLYMIKADAKNGISFLARPCQTPDHFGSWVTFSMKIRWAADNTGWIKVTCNDRIVYADEGVATDQSPHCFITNVCEPDIVKHPKSIHLVLGPVMAGFGYEWKKYGKPSPFTAIQKDGITVRFRNISISSKAELYVPAERSVMQRLQQRLTELGCDPGPADGVARQQTRETALSCRKFPDGVLPGKLTVETVKAFLDAYDGAGVADLPKGGIDVPKAGVAVLINEIQSVRRGADINAESYIRVSGKGVNAPLHFGVKGLLTKQDAARLELLLDLKLNRNVERSLGACGVEYDNLKRGAYKTEITINRVTLRMRRQGTSFAFPAADCMMAALPKRERAKAQFLLSHFRDIAIAMVRQGRLPDIHHNGVETFFRRVALGEVAIVP